MDLSRLAFRFHVVDAAIDLSGPADVVAPIAATYGRFVVDEASGAVEADPGGANGASQVNGRDVPVPPGIDPIVQAYGRFTRAIQDLVEGPALLHGSSLVGPDGRAVIISAPAAHGKTTLGLELLARGHRFLTDDYAPLDLATGTIAPFPRRIAIRPGGRALVPAPFARAAAAEETPRLLGKSVVDVGDVLGEHVMADPAPIGCVVLVTSRDPARRAPRISRFTVCAAIDAAERLDEVFCGIPGVRILGRYATDHEAQWLIAARGGAARLAEVLAQDDDDLLLVERAREDAPDFRLPPAAERIGRLEAATVLASEMFNRRPDGRFMARLGGSVPLLIASLAAALTHATCWRLRPGPLHETADLVERLQRETP